MVEAPLQYLLSAREYDLLLRGINKRDRQGKQISSSALLRRPATSRDFNAAAFRSAFRLYLITKYGLKTWEVISARIFRRTAASPTVIKRVYLDGNTKLALAASSFLFFFRIIFGFLTRLRLKLLHEKAKEIQSRYPKLFTSFNFEGSTGYWCKSCRSDARDSPSRPIESYSCYLYSIPSPGDSVQLTRCTGLS